MIGLQLQAVVGGQRIEVLEYAAVPGLPISPRPERVLFVALVLGCLVFVGPMLAMAFYAISHQLQKGRVPSLGHSIRASWRHIGNQMVFAIILLVIFLVWARAVSLTHVFFPMQAQPDLAEMAAALFESLIMNHPFVDGNKRVAFFATDVFLRLHGYKLKVEANKAHRFLIGLLDNDCCNFDQLLPWIRKHVAET